MTSCGASCGTMILPLRKIKLPMIRGQVLQSHIPLLGLSKRPTNRHLVDCPT